jgi:hypothetical protein
MNTLKYKDIAPAILGKSQKGQDSLLQYTFLALGTTNQYYVEFGARDGVLDSNTWFLRERLGWNGLLLDCLFENKDINLHKRTLTKDNIVNTFKEFNVPNEFDFLNIDIDGNDYWLLKSILEGGYKPRVIMVETNVRFSPETDLVQRYDENWYWQGSGWYGCSPLSMAILAEQHGYVPVHIHLDDMILVRADVLKENGYEPLPWNQVYPHSNIPLYSDHRDNVFNPDMWVTPLWANS